MLSAFDRLIIEMDQGIRTVFGVHTDARPTPGRDIPEADLSDSARSHAAGLMRVNHCGEVCAQALYQGQALASRNDALTSKLRAAAREEEDHLAWTEARIRELGGQTSLLNPLWYIGSLAMGYAAGKAGDAWSLGFLKETERQVERHLEGHLERLDPDDVRTREIVVQMKADEAGHADMAARLGARELPFPVKRTMAAVAKVMTTLSYRV
ncbi:MAG: 2-polyprenyl-3-methyl-6-methoxy-1,4-benzoquinone monooxygenase [Betaproteobacteria bacterium]|jgi:ubiquinone biosynthesis monooxygenase Coq7|nr:2-polyprenyl-3-methyl-6-methoxy-1,4-benzoquinone monooxygenase [Betaproteobacteria bacterium]